MRDFRSWITEVAPDWEKDLADDLANTFDQLNKLISDYMLKVYSPIEFSEKTEEVEAILKGSWDDQLDADVINDMLAEFYERRKHGEADELIRVLRKQAEPSSANLPDNHTSKGAA